VGRKLTLASFARPQKSYTPEQFEKINVVTA